MNEPSVVWIVEREFIVSRTFTPIICQVFGSKKEADAEIRKNHFPIHQYRAAKYQRVVE